MQRNYPGGPRPTDVYFFATCLVDLFCPEAGMDAIRLLEREGIRVHFPENQTCCGQPAYTSGYADEARAVARVQLDLFPNDWPVIVPSGSCGGMIKTHYPELFAVGTPERAKADARMTMRADAREVIGRVAQVVDELHVRERSRGSDRVGA